MAYDSAKPADTQFISAGPADIRTNQEALRIGQIVDAEKVKGYSPGNASGNLPVSNGTLCTNLNADKLDGNEASAFATAGHTHGAATTSSNGFMANTDKSKLDGIASGAEVNQNAFANIVVGSTTIQANAKSDTFTMISGQNITLTGDAVNDKVTVAVSGAIPIANGGTGATTADAALINLGLTATAAELNYVDGVTSNVQTQLNDKAPTAHASTATTYGAASATNYGHAKATEAEPLVAGTAAVGTDNGLYARGDHVHPAQTSVSGNAGTATKLATARTISLTGDVTGSATFDGSANAAITATVTDDSHTHTAATISGVGGGRQLFTASGTFTVPAGVTEVYVTASGGGGGGGNYVGNPYNMAGCGGGSGRQCVKRKLAVTPGQAYTITIGAGGAARTAGGATSFGALLTVIGGGAGGAGSDPRIPGTGEFNGGGSASGGIGADGQYSFYQMRGIGSNESGGGGGGGQGLFNLFDGTKAGNGTGRAGTGAYGYGAGGGGGGTSGGVGGAGAPGVLLVEW